MSSQGNGQPVHYEVKASIQVQNTIKHLHQQAIQRGRGKPFLEALRTIYTRLRTDPEQVGEPLYNLPALNLLVCHAVVSPVAVVFAVHQERPLVFLREVKLLD